MEEGFGYSEKQLRSSDCETVTARTEYYPSPARAEDEMLKKLKESTNIIERGPKLKCIRPTSRRKSSSNVQG